MEQLNSGESKTIFRNISRIVFIGLDRWNKAWQQEEETRTLTGIVLIRQNEKFFTFKLFKVIQDRTMLLFRATSSSTFFMSDVQFIYISQSIRD